MKMKKCISLLLSLCMALTVFAAFSVTALAANAPYVSGSVLHLAGNVTLDNVSSALTDSVTSVVADSGAVLPSDCSYMFNGFWNITSVDIRGADTSAVTVMTAMFDGCMSLESVNMSGLDTSRLTAMDYLFHNCYELTSVDFSGWDTSSVTTMSDLFDNCESLTYVDLSSFDTSSVTDMSFMFFGCAALAVIRVDADLWDTSSVTASEYMFTDATSLVGGYGTVYDGRFVNKIYARVDAGENRPGYLTGDIVMVLTASALKSAIENVGGTIILGADIAVDELIKIPNGSDVTIDLNGYTLSQTAPGCGVLYVESSSGLTVTDHSDNGGGTITGGYQNLGGGIYCNGATLVVENVTVSDNIASYGGGGIANYMGSVTLKNAAIENNSADYYGGGIYNFRGSVTLIDTTVTNNSATSYAGGIYSSSNGASKRVNLSGSTVIKNNTHYDLYLHGSYRYFNISGALTSDASIGVATQSILTDYADLTIGLSGNGGLSNFFLNDDAHSDYMLGINSDGELAMGKIVTVTFDANGASGSMDSETVALSASLTLPECGFTRDGYSFGGWDIDGTVYAAGAVFTPDVNSGTTSYTASAVWDSYWIDLQNAIDNAQEGELITLEKDAVAPGDQSYLNIADGVYVILDLNGHSIDRNLSSAVSGGHVIKIQQSGTLVIVDNRGGGKITGGNTLGDAGGISNYGTLILSGGSITGNSATSSAGGVRNWDGSYMFMYGGSITNNTTQNYHGGAIYNGGMLNVSGGVITGNTAAFQGGAILENGELRISGNPKIYGNTAPYGDNVYLRPGKVMIVEQALTSGVNIGVTLEGDRGVITSNLSGYGSADAFFSDNEALIIGTDTDGEAILGDPVTLTFASGGGSGSMDGVTLASGSSYTLPECEFTSENAFAHWDIGGVSYSAGDVITVTADTTAVADYRIYHAAVTPTYDAATGVYTNGNIEYYTYSSCDGCYTYDGTDYTAIDASGTVLPYFNIVYVADTGEIKINRFYGDDTEIVIPDYVPANYPVESIRGEAITTVGAYVFKDNDAITSVTMGDSVELIGYQAFMNCPNLESVTVGTGLKHIYYQSFGSCPALTSFTCYSRQTFETYSSPFIGSANVTVYGYHGTSFKNKVGSSRTFVGIDAHTGTPTWSWNGFASAVASLNCSNCKFSETKDAEITSEVTIEPTYDAVGEITYTATVVIDGVEYTDTAVGQIEMLESGFSYNVAGDNARIDGYNGNIPAELTIPAVIDGYGVSKVATNAFMNKDITGVFIEDGVGMLNYGAFSGCSALETVTLPKSITYIGKKAFNGCTSLTDVYYGGTQVDWDNLTIEDKNDALINATVHFSDDITLNYVATGANAKITGYEGTVGTTLVIPSEIDGYKVTKTASSLVFFNCKLLKTVTIMPNFKTVEYGTFSNCKNMTSIVIPKTVRVIGNAAFKNCNSLTDVYYGGSEEGWAKISIGSGNTALTNATIHFAE